VLWERVLLLDRDTSVELGDDCRSEVSVDCLRNLAGRTEGEDGGRGEGGVAEIAMSTK
jgi:hypothetical protein